MEQREKKWIKQIQKRADEDAANELISAYYKEMYAYVYKQTTNKELAMDLTQEVFISMLQSIDGFDAKKSSFRTWLYKIATYRVVDYYRSKYYKYIQAMAPMDEELVDETIDFTLAIEQKQEVEKISELIREFDAFSQQIFRLKLFAEYTFSEIAAVLHEKEATVKTRYYSGLKKIKKTLEEEQNGEKTVSYRIPG